jgi:hypothetical protein
MVTFSKDLRGKFGAARDQGARPTCLAFATSDVHATSRGPSFVPLSPEFLYYHAVQKSKSPDPSDGVTLAAIRSALKTDGQPIETDWPYLTSVPTALSKWAPPSGLTVFRQTLLAQPNSVEDVINALEDDHPVLLCLKISEAFHAPDPDGLVSYIKDDPDTGYHAVVGVALGASGSKRMILVRNSWGEDWGLAGNGWLHSKYVSDRLHSASIIQ